MKQIEAMETKTAFYASRNTLIMEVQARESEGWAVRSVVDIERMSLVVVVYEDNK